MQVLKNDFGCFGSVTDSATGHVVPCFFERHPGFLLRIWILQREQGQKFVFKISKFK